MPTTQAPEIEIPDGIEQEDEALGTKPKFWFRDAAGARVLFKRAVRPGEDWSEWLAARVAHEIGVVCAPIALARHRGERGTASQTFRAADEQLFHGNELLSGLRPDYPAQGLRGVSAHTVAASLQALDGVKARCAEGRRSASEAFVGYLLLDALIGNSDRHHENWGVLRGTAGTRLAPSYDHAASLGWNLPEAKVLHRLEERDRRSTVQAYCRRARSAFYLNEGDARPMHPVEAFIEAARLRPQAAPGWLERARELRLEAVSEAASIIPADRISEAHRRFAVKMLACNRARILQEGPAQ